VGVGLGDCDGDEVGSGDGKVVGAGAVLLVVTDSVTDFVFPDVSVARDVSVWAPFSRLVVSSGVLQLDVPEATAKEPPSTDSSTFESPTLSEAVPVTVIVPEAVDPAAGPENAIAGAVVSGVGHAFALLQEVVLRAIAPGKETAATIAMMVETMTVLRRTNVEAERIATTPRRLSKAALAARQGLNPSGVDPLRFRAAQVSPTQASALCLLSAT
jgi:hypothetical protein